ncbi:spermidine/putrescine ABC transporter [Pararhodobacter marinus]|uniref:Spermidine/putrescine ABC transporter n=1 Tax=Pararhodobacter marinus TaxID=2184063 RepID=A0A2U2CD17_9RHOB|nr:ABC transporter ATP-binding protein [Pararhodobacter marinus]PWE29750.1 spermidine/putrescine ABC transporter [Pararhodobacter marinus]
MADIVLSAVDKIFGSDRVVSNVDLTVENGEFFSLLGPSGCGKTTTLRMIAGLETPTSGDVTIRGQRMNDVPINKRPTNLVFQKMALFPHLDVFENVAFGLRLKRLPGAEIKRKVGDILDVVSLTGFEKRAVSQLSGGQQQRVAIARALVNEPAVLLLDEPLGALDLKLQLHLQRELRRIQKATGTTFIYVTHNQAEALSMSDRLAVMNGGKIEQIGTPAEMYLRPATSFVASFIGRTNLIEARIDNVTSGAAHLSHEGLPLSVPAEELGAGETVMLSLRPERIEIRAPGAEGIDATVTEAEFMGSTVLYRMKTASDRTLIVQTLADRAPLRDGESARIGWAPDAAVQIRQTSVAEDIE